MCCVVVVVFSAVLLSVLLFFSTSSFSFHIFFFGITEEITTSIWYVCGIYTIWMCYVRWVFKLNTFNMCWIFTRFYFDVVLNVCVIVISCLFCFLIPFSYSPMVYACFLHSYTCIYLYNTQRYTLIQYFDSKAERVRSFFVRHQSFLHVDSLFSRYDRSLLCTYSLLLKKPLTVPRVCVCVRFCVQARASFKCLWWWLNHKKNNNNNQERKKEMKRQRRTELKSL